MRRTLLSLSLLLIGSIGYSQVDIPDVDISKRKEYVMKNYNVDSKKADRYEDILHSLQQEKEQLRNTKISSIQFKADQRKLYKKYGTFINQAFYDGKDRRWSFCTQELEHYHVFSESKFIPYEQMRALFDTEKVWLNKRERMSKESTDESKKYENNEALLTELNKNIKQILGEENGSWYIAYKRTVNRALVIILSISLINWKIQIYKVIVQLNAILNRKTKKLVTVSLSDRRLEHLVEIINQIVSKDNIYLGEIQKKENELKENISCLSHDLRTPLTSIRGYLQLLSSAPDEKRAEYISALSGKALRLERLIDDFYQISLLEAGQYPFYYEKVELCSLLTEILLDNYSIFSVNGIEPQIEIPNMDIYLNADRKACIRIIQNLIFNAVTSTTNNVVIQLINIADSVQLCIKNPVASIPTEEYSKLLERFYVADVSRSNGTSGQGLYIVKKLLLMMNCTNPIIEIHDHNFMITIDFSPLLIKK